MAQCVLLSAFLLLCAGALTDLYHEGDVSEKGNCTVQYNKIQKFCSVRSVVLWSSAALTAPRLAASDLQLLSHVPARARSSVIWRSREHHSFFEE